MELDGFVVRKAELEKRKNDDEASARGGAQGGAERTGQQSCGCTLWTLLLLLWALALGWA